MACWLASSLSSPSLGRSPGLRVKASGFPPAFPGRYVILKSKRKRNSDHRACRRLNSFVLMKYSGFLWSLKTWIGWREPSK